MPKKNISNDQKFHYQGFTVPNGTIVPDDVFDILMPHLSDIELRVLLYIIRRTFGFKKQSDNISLRQIVHGITTHDGRVLDSGAGISKPSAIKAARLLEEKGIIIKQANYSPERGDEATTYGLRFTTAALPSDEIKGEPVSTGLTRGGKRDLQEGVNGVDTQQTVEQETVMQQTDINSNSLEGSTLHNADLQLFSKKKVENLNFSASEETQGDDNSKDDGEYQPQTPTGNGLRSVGQVLNSRKLPSRRPETAEEPSYSPQAAPRAPSNRGRPPKAPEWLMRLVRDTSEQLHDHYHVEQNIGQAARLWKQTGAEDHRFQSKWSEAKQITQGYTVAKACDDHPTLLNRMPYLFAVLRDLLGLKDEAVSSNPTSPSRAKGVNEQETSSPDTSSNRSASYARLQAKANRLRTRTPT